MGGRWSWDLCAGQALEEGDIIVGPRFYWRVHDPRPVERDDDSNRWSMACEHLGRHELPDRPLPVARLWIAVRKATGRTVPLTPEVCERLTAADPTWWERA